MSEEQSKEKQTAIEELADDDKNRELIEEAVENETKKVIAEVIQGEFSGPIPPPSIIEGYERVLPGSADRIMLHPARIGRTKGYIFLWMTISL